MLLSKDKENERLKTMEATNDGFKIAEKDLELRGTGQILGVKQSGKDSGDGDGSKLSAALSSSKEAGGNPV